MPFIVTCLAISALASLALAFMVMHRPEWFLMLVFVTGLLIAGAIAASAAFGGGQ